MSAGRLAVSIPDWEGLLDQTLQGLWLSFCWACVLAFLVSVAVLTDPNRRG